MARQPTRVCPTRPAALCPFGGLLVSSLSPLPTPPCRFRELRDGRGLPIIVRETAPLQNETAAEMWLRDPQEVADFLSLFLRKTELVHLNHLEKD